MNNGIRSQAQAAPALPHGLLGSPSPIPTPGGRVEWVYDPNNLVLVFDTSREPANRQVSVPLQSANVVINWGDGTSSAVAAPAGGVWATKTYATGGVYVVQISGRMDILSWGLGGGNFSQDNRPKLIRCLSFGNLGITSLLGGFQNCQNFVQCPAILPTTSRVTNLTSCFQNCTAFNGDCGLWDTSSVTLMNNTFQQCSNFNRNLSAWNTARVSQMSSMFNGATRFNQPVGGWNTGSVVTMVNMFSTASAFNQPIGGWDVSNVLNMQGMFTSATSFSADISTWDIRRCGSMGSSFVSGTAWGTANYDAALQAWAALPDEDLTTGSISAFATNGAGSTLVTSVGHGLPAGFTHRVEIRGTTNYNGTYNVSVSSADAFAIPVNFVADDATGTFAQRRRTGISASFGSNKYSAGAAATSRGVLTGTYGWAITDGGQA